MSFLFRKSRSTRQRIRDKLRGRNSDKREEERSSIDGGGSGSPSRPPPPSPWGFLFYEDFVRIDGNLKAVIVDENGLDVIYWRRLLELESGGKITNPRARRRREGDDGRNRATGTGERDDGDDEEEEEEEEEEEGEIDTGLYRRSRQDKRNGSGQESFSFPERKSGSSSSGGEIRDCNVDGRRYSSSASASPSMASTSTINNYGATGKSKSKTQAANFSTPSLSPSWMFSTQSTDGPPPLPLPPGQVMVVAASPSSPPPQQQALPTQSTGGPSPPLPPPPGQLTVAAMAAPPSPPPLPPAKRAAPPPPPPPPPAAGAPPPPPPIPGKQGPPPPPPLKKGPPSKPPAHPKEPTKEGESSSGSGNGGDQAKPKLKPLHWDKVNPNASHSMVWDRIDGGSFNFDGDLMEALFGYVATKKPSEGNITPQNPIVSTAQTYILEPRKSQNKAIVLKSLGMTKDEMIDLLTEGHDADADTLEKLTKIAPTQEEQMEILEFSGDPTKLADAESFLFHILRAVPTAFTRFNAMLFQLNYGPEVAHHKESLKTLESACNELRARGLFMKLLEAVLKAGNRMNAGTARGNAQAFNLTALRKLSEVKSVDGKTTLLHFVVEEVVRSEGKRAAMNKNGGNISESNSENADASKEEQEKEYIRLGLPIVGGLSPEFTNVKKAAGIDHDGFAATSLALSARIGESRRFLDQSQGKEDGFLTKLRSFLESAEEELRMVTDEQARVMAFVKKTTNYYQAGALKDKNPFQLFVMIRDFLGMVDNVCSAIAKNQQNKRVPKAEAGTSTSNTAGQRNAVRFPILPPNFMSEHSRYSSSDSDSDS